MCFGDTNGDTNCDGIISNNKNNQINNNKDNEPAINYEDVYLFYLPNCSNE